MLAEKPTSYGDVINADLILVDAHYYSWTKITLDFTNAIHVNLSSKINSSHIPPLGEFLQSIIEVAEDIASLEHDLKKCVLVISS